ncbi:MAG: Panacea domain-containing protein [Candidatus Saccharimonadales bacterium]
MNEPSEKLQRVANYFIATSHDADKVITNKKLQKLVYYAQAWNLVFNDNPLFTDPIEAWIHGPAIRTLYSKYKKYSYNTIAEEPQVGKLAAKEQAVLEDIWAIYGKFDADYLEALTHNEEPWLAARGNAETDERTSITIDPDLMKSFYARLLKTVKA